MENVDKTTDNIDAGPRPTQPENEGESRNRNLDILKAYIQRQRALLERIKQDLDRLQTAKPALEADSSSVLSRILRVDNNDNSRMGGQSLDKSIGGVGKISELISEVHEVGEATITKDIDWNVFRGSDRSALDSLQPHSRTSLNPTTVNSSTAPPYTPSTPSLISARSSLSSFVSLDDSSFGKSFHHEESVLQIHVREERVKAVNPALTIAAEFLASLPPDSDDECVKQARAREAREAKEAKAREAREARKVKLQNVQVTKPTANPASKKGHIRKSAHRRKSEASAAAAAQRPRGHGGRFKKKEPEQVTNDVSAPEFQTVGASTSASVPTISASISLSSVPDNSPSTQLTRFASLAPSLISLDEDLSYIGNGRPQRTRKPSIRFGSAAPSVSSSRSTRSGSSSSGRRNGKPDADWQSTYSPAVPNNPPRGRLTIRIPARLPAKSTVLNASDQRDGQFSSSTSMTTATSVTTGESGYTSQMLSTGNGNHGLKGIKFGLEGWGSISEDRPRSPSPGTATVSASRTNYFDVKQEEEDAENGMDIDNWDALDELNGRLRENSVHQPFQTLQRAEYNPSSQGDEIVMHDNDHNGGSDSDDSFVPELLPPLPDSATSSSSASRSSANGAANGANGKLDASRSSSRRGDPSSKTFNVSWSDEEQRLLDMLLERYPDGTKNRWANISRAMGGSRTPRQVASRVQKYFAKMKKWGIDLS